ncbi:MAG TPA: branched-chain amino acid ABC transporter substrate-binding protein [Candidatus Paceibacterota bacterium]|nr:branched-chain amino acid ABC transporter substrate-binding protein [Candidatus Paceibacterota bacterium]
MENTEETKPPETLSTRSIMFASVGAIAILIIFWGVVTLVRKPTIAMPSEVVYTIYASAPVQYEIGDFPIKAAQLALEQEQAKPRNYRLRFIALDDSTLNGEWDEMRLRENLKIAIKDPTTIAFFGPILSTAAKIAIPMLNVEGIPIISPTNTWPGLTKPGFSIDEPGRYYPTQKRNYVRFSTTDELELTNAATWAQSLGMKTVSITGDKSLDPATTLFFSKRAEELGIKVNSRSFLEDNNTFQVAKNLITEKPDLVYHLGANSTLFTKFIRDLRRAGYRGSVMVSDSVLSQSLFDAATPELEGVYVTSVSIPVDKLGNSLSERFIDAYKERYKAAPDTSAGMAYESMKILINAIDKSDHTREGIIRELFNTHNFPSMFGSVTIDSNGDNVSGNIGGSIIKNGSAQYIGVIGHTPNLID